ncbi:MAG: DNRLRE domain-containing protein [Candidatus Eiseniibacteriota bacterium]
MKTLLTLAAGLIMTTSGVPGLFTCGIKDVSTIQDGRGSNRILFNLDGSGPSGDFSIAEATLTLDLSGTGQAGVLRLRIHPVTTQWSAAAAGWTSGWSRAGGDFEETVFARAEVDLAQTGTVSIDVTSIMKEVLQSRMPAYGFIVTTDPATRTAGLSTAELSRLESFASASVEVHYRTTPPRPRK